ncbi:hypothetical protein RvY_03871-4 [Ramazzottius varieornatus]|uniref:Uncharacterized protein n=1 Tax=Ramazzottius varieornatus TaxID=947166 RepID=A0A1D1UYW9_RAMVA|nr:hypothetical protein RvY_03871-4 [Ramazzottius varieornatus]
MSRSPYQMAHVFMVIGCRDARLRTTISDVLIAQLLCMVYWLTVMSNVIIREISATVLGETFHSLMVDEAWEVSQIQSITEFLAKYGVYSGVVAAFCLSVKATKPLHLLPTKYVETSSMEKLGDERNIQDYVNAFMKSFLLQGKENLEVVREVLLAVGLPFLDAKLASLGAGGRLWSERDVVESIRKTVDVEMERNLVSGMLPWPAACPC